MTNPTPYDDPETAGRDESSTEADIGPRPRTGGDVTGLGPIQIALALLALFVVLLVIWMVWPLISGA